MPELPEVETVRRGITPCITGKVIKDVVIRERRLRWPISPGLKKKLCGNKITRVDRRGKYLLLTVSGGVLLIHLGMSGRLRVLPEVRAVEKHDHLDIIFADEQILRYTDSRRFGSILWVTGEPLKHKLLVKLGPEPLEKGFNTRYLFDISRNKKVPVKSLIMDSHRVVGVGNIYANEALFLAGIHPLRAAGSLSREDTALLASKIKEVLKAAIRSGGTTLRDFMSAEGKPGYFQQKLYVYGRGGLPCTFCGQNLIESKVAGRSTVYCSNCQR
jgi:formamidopyrimidine-DNA glycosylase